MFMQVFTPDGSIVDGEIVDHKNGTYEFVYTVPKEGDFSLALRLYDQHIKGSPFKLTITKVLEAEVEVGRVLFFSCFYNICMTKLPDSCQPSLRYASQTTYLPSLKVSINGPNAPIRR